jgi:poly(A) polymerase
MYMIFPKMTNAFFLKSALKLDSPPWQGDTALALLLATLNKGGPTLLVGGCVRNAVIGQTPGDYDLATVLTPEQVIDYAARAGLRSVPTGIEHGTVTVVVEERGFEVTTLRRDVDTDGRHAQVTFSKDWAEDAARRDFTMNTLLADLSGQVFEPLPGALRDAKAGMVRFVGDPAARIAEDYLRILRFFRFHARYGQGEMEQVALDACQAAAEHLSKLSRERITQELLKWLMAPAPSASFQTAIDRHILDAVIPVPLDARALDVLAAHQVTAHLPHVVTRLFALAPNHIVDLAGALVLSTKQVKFLHALQKLSLSPQITETQLRQVIYRHGHDVVLQKYLYVCARDTAAPLDLTPLVAWVPPALPVSGDDLLNLGVTPGPELGQRLIAIEEKWIASDFTLDKGALLA